MVKSKLGNVAASVILAVLGVLLIVYPTTSLTIAVRLLGVALLLAGVAAIVAYFVKEERYRLDGFQCIGGAVFVVISLVVLTNPGFVISIFPILTGVTIAIYGIVGVVQTMSYRDLELRGWQMNMALSVITICIGILIFANPFGAVEIALRLVGAVLIYSGLTGIWFAIIK